MRLRPSQPVAGMMLFAGNVVLTVLLPHLAFVSFGKIKCPFAGSPSCPRGAATT